MWEEGLEFVQFNLRVQDTEVVEIVGRKLMMQVCSLDEQGQGFGDKGSEGIV